MYPLCRISSYATVRVKVSFKMDAAFSRHSASNSAFCEISDEMKCLAMLKAL